VSLNILLPAAFLLCCSLLQALVPPSAIPLINTWLIENKALPPPPPRAEWGKIQTPQHKELVELSERGIGIEGSNATAAAAAAASPAPDAAAAAAAAPPAAAARSAAGSSKVAGTVFVAVATVAAVALWV
jgi:hypothetical protein